MCDDGAGANVNLRDNSGRKPVDMLNYSCSESIRGEMEGTILCCTVAAGRGVGNMCRTAVIVSFFLFLFLLHSLAD